MRAQTRGPMKHEPTCAPHLKPRTGRPSHLSIMISLVLTFTWTIPLQAAAPIPARGAHGMVVTSEPLAAEVGREVLREGGNAVDAAVAVGFTLAVTYPYAGNLGGGGFMLIRMANQKDVVALDFREVAPAAASRDMYLKSDGTPDSKKSTYGYQSVAVPGTVAGLTLALEKYGTRKLSAMVAPSIKLAEKGYTMSWTNAKELDLVAADLKGFSSSAAILLKPDGTPWREGEKLVQEDLAKTLKAIAKDGAAGFYKGPVAEAIAKDMAAHGGLITAADLAAYKPVVRTALHGTYHGYDIYTMPPPSSGGIHLLEMLNLLEPFSLPSLGHDSARTIHLMVESMKRAYADRSKFLGDPAFTEVPVEGLTSKGYADWLRAGFDPYHATPSKEILPGDPSKRGAPPSSYVSPAYQESLAPEAPPVHPGSQTTHYSVTDQLGNAVSFTYTLNLPFGSKVVAAGTGVLLNDEMDDFSAKTGTANAYGLIGSDANAIAPGKRPLSSMTPTIVTRAGKVELVTGSPGGARIITATLQVVLNVLDFKMDVMEAVSAPRVHHQWLPDDLWIEPQLSEDTRAALGAMGYHVTVHNPWGATNSIARDANGVWLGGFDPRKDGAAMGY